MLFVFTRRAAFFGKGGDGRREETGMVIGKAYEDTGHAAHVAGMERAKAAAMAACRAERARRGAMGSNPRFRKRSSVHADALAEAIRTEGPEVMGPAAAGYWRDMERANPWMVVDGRPEDGNSLNGRYGRHGKVSRRFAGGKWHRWRDGRWMEE